MKRKKIVERNRSLLKRIDDDLSAVLSHLRDAQLEILLRDEWLPGDDIKERNINRKIYAVSRQLDRAAKKLSNLDPALAKVAVDNFVEVNNQAKAIRELRIPSQILGDARMFVHDVLERFTRKYVSNAGRQATLDMGLLYNLWRLGPGASYGLGEITHFVEKIQCPWTVTRNCLPLAEQIRRFTPRLRIHDCVSGTEGVTLVRGSRLGTVPKNAETDRTKTTDPSGNMAVELSIAMYLTGALNTAGLYLENQQDKNNRLAYLGSINGETCTIDLKNATDLIVPLLIYALYPRDFYYLMMAARPEEVEIGKDWVPLHMMSTMGNGFTFPLCTLTLLALCYGVARSMGGKYMWLDYTKWGVFGDDIICPKDAFPLLCDVLHGVGLQVNLDKSFSVGAFRESCGGDYYDGYDVTPFYVKSITNDAEVYVAINQVLDWCCKHDVVMLSTLEYLGSLLEGPVLYVPEWEEPTAGILTARRPDLDRKSRYPALKLVRESRKVECKNDLHILSLLGGYGRSNEDGDLVYVPRGEATYKRSKSFFPKGWTDGALRGPKRIYGELESQNREVLVELVFQLTCTSD